MSQKTEDRSQELEDFFPNSSAGNAIDLSADYPSLERVQGEEVKNMLKSMPLWRQAGDS